MKKILITFSLVLIGFTMNAQDSLVTNKYKCYKPCPDCSEKWKTGNGSSPQSYDLRTNQMALQTKNKTNNFVRTIGGIVATVFIGTFTAIVITKSNNLANNANR